MSHVALWIYPGIIAGFSLLIFFLLFFRWTKNKDESLFFWYLGFLSYALSYILNALFVANVLPVSGFMFVFLHFLRQSFVSLLFVFVYLGIVVLITKKRIWRVLFPLVFLLVQELVIAYFDFFRYAILYAENLHIFLFDIPFNVLICVLFMRYWLMSRRRFSLLQCLAWFGYVVIVSIGFGVKFSIFFYTISLLPMLVMLVGFVDYYKRPLEEHILEITPKLEAYSKDAPLKYKIEPGKVHLVKEPKAHKSYDMFIDNVMHKVYGLCISRKNPNKVKLEYGIQSTPVVWLTRIEPDVMSLNPIELEQLTFTITQYLEKVGKNKSVVLLDGIEYLASTNPFNKVIHAIGMLKDKLSGTNSSIIIPIDQYALPSKDFSILIKEIEG
ncbi:DUF835 domain-containing protein [Candidatus Woesearchaeota archaeon]|nr:DUF835 domain-containing protein [Candidatus Woesearchaeota archaeon]